MNPSNDTPARAATTETVVVQEWDEAFGDLDLDSDNDSHTTTAVHSSSSPEPTATPAASHSLNTVEPLWFVRTDELAATKQFSHDNKSRVREILNFRVDRACWLYGRGRYQEALDVVTAPQQLDWQGKQFNSKESDIAPMNIALVAVHSVVACLLLT